MEKKRESLKAKVPQSDVPGLYDRLARFYDLWGHLAESKARARALELAEFKDGQSVLEVAVGTGLAFAEVVRKNPHGRNIGIDLSRGMLARAERRLRRGGLSNFQLAVASAFALPEADHSFDIVLNNYMFDLLDEQDWPKALGEFHRVLKPGGKLVLVNMTRGEGLGTGIYEVLYRLSPRLMGGCRSVLLSGPLQRHGFFVKHREYVQQLLFPSEVILATKSTAP